MFTAMKTCAAITVEGFELCPAQSDEPGAKTQNHSLHRVAKLANTSLKKTNLSIGDNRAIDDYAPSIARLTMTTKVPLNEFKDIFTSGVYA